MRPICTLFVLALVACGHAQHANAHLALADILVYEGNESVVHLLADGALQILEKGTMNGTAYEEWKTVGKLASDGTFVSVDGKTTLVTPDRRMTISPSGAVLLDNAPCCNDKLVRVEGITDATRQTALLVLALALH